MKKLIFTTTILLLFVSCAVTKHGKTDYTSYQQPIENSTQNTGTKSVQTTEYKGSATNKNAVSAINAQTDKNVLCERLISELLPQNKEYNRYKYAREEYIIFSLSKDYEWEDCHLVKESIEKFYAANPKERYEHPVGYIRYIGYFQCREAYDFLETQIKENPLEEDRCAAITTLAQKLNPDYLPCILEYAEKKSLSINEKYALASAYTVFGIYNDRPDLIEKAVIILDELCYDYKNGVVHDCIWEYFKIGGQPALDFFYYYLEKNNSRLVAAQKLAELGGLNEYKKTFPIFIEAINSGNQNDIHIALYGLAAIGTEDAFELIRKQTKSDNEFIAKEAKWILENINIKGGQK